MHLLWSIAAAEASVVFNELWLDLHETSINILENKIKFDLKEE
jgi:hypothetical protein